MNILKTIFIFLFVLTFTVVPFQDSRAGLGNNFIWYFDTDAGSSSNFRAGLAYFFDLRDRETFIQVTFPALDPDLDEFTGDSATAHVQIFNVADNCNENDFFDNYTPNDTHTYNMRDIQTNDGNPSGVFLPDGAYGIVIVVVDANSNREFQSQSHFGNMRIIDNNGYEYRTNAQGGVTFFDSEISINEFIGTEPFLTFNFNKEAGITFSDVVGITTLRFRDEDLAVPLSYDAQDVGNTFYPMDIDIYNLNEVPFSCRNIIFSCVDQDNPRLEELLENAGSASVASFEYGINDAIPHSKGGELLCPGNNIEEGFVRLTPLNIPASVIDNLQSKENILEPFTPTFYGYIGLNNGNGRGSFDSFWVINPLSVLIGS